jgi:hypothetical protein
MIVIPCGCAWGGCAESFSAEMLPEGWISLVTFRETATPGLLDFLKDRTQRDAVLCPAHAIALERQLKRL